MSDFLPDAALQAAVNAKWDEAGLTTIFKEKWPEPTADFDALHDSEAREGTPWPYCIVEFGAGAVDSRMSHGPSAGQNPQPTKKNRIDNIDWQFRIHDKSKTRCAKMVKIVSDAFEGFRPTLSAGRHMQTVADPPFGARNGDSEWVWVIPFTTTIDQEYTA